MRQARDVIMSETGDAVSDRWRVTMPLLVLRVLKRLPGVLVSREVWLFSILLAYAMCVGRAVFEFGRALVVLVMGSVVVSSGHRASRSSMHEEDQTHCR